MSRRSLACAAALVLSVAPAAAHAQEMHSALLSRALQLEGTGKSREAVPLFRQALADPALGDEGRAAAILGLERVWDELGQRDSIVPLVTATLRTRPADPTLRGVQLRALVTLRRDAEARMAYGAWRRAAPGDATPFREYARLLLGVGRAAAADTVLREAALSLRGPRGVRALSVEMAQLHAALGAWARAGQSWRDAVDEMPYIETAALYSLSAAPAAARDSLLPPLLAPPVTLPPRRLAAQLLVAWRRPREAWDALAALPSNDSTRAAWRDAAERLEAAEAWPVARDAWTRVLEADRDPDAARRAAAAALAANDAAGALALLDRAGAAPKGAAAADAAVLRVRALAALGRADEAERVASEAAGALDASDRERLADALAEAWITKGDVARARAALSVAGVREDAPVAGWLALYAGDLKRARTLLKRPTEELGAARTDLTMTALAVVARTRADSVPAVGAAFLSAARGDTAAATRFIEAARLLPEAASLLVVSAARMHAARGDTTAALPLWERVATDYASTPEAPEANLAWARALRARGDAAGARARLEHLIVTYPESALVPIARRELDAVRAAP